MPVRAQESVPETAQELVPVPVRAQELVPVPVRAQVPVPVGASACIQANWLAVTQAPRETRALGPARAPVRGMRRRHRLRKRPGPHRLPTGHSGVAAAQWFSISLNLDSNQSHRIAVEHWARPEA